MLKLLHANNKEITQKSNSFSDHLQHLLPKTMNTQYCNTYVHISQALYKTKTRKQQQNTMIMQTATTAFKATGYVLLLTKKSSDISKCQLRQASQEQNLIGIKLA